MTDDMSAYRDVFLSESAEYLQAVVDGLLALESDPTAIEPIETVFRGAHSLKGMAGAMGYDATASLTHVMETLMDAVRKKRRSVDSELVDLMLRAVDTVRTLIAEESQGTPPSEISSIVAEIVAMAGSAPEAEAVAQEAEGPVAASGSPPGAGGAARQVRVTVTLEQECALKSVRAYMVLKRLAHIGRVVDTAPSARDLEDEKFDQSFEVLLESEASDVEIVEAATHVTDVASASVSVEGPVEVPETLEAEGGEETPRRREIPKIGETQTVRVTIGHLDNLVNLVGELVILRSRMDGLSEHLSDRGFSEAVEDLYRISAELQHEVMQTRMVPVGNIFNRFPRMVRDLARDLGKDVEFVMDGSGIELDRTVLDEIGDPVVHLLRNSLDHGIEPPDEREAAGKARRARVTLVAARERDQVRISVADDGRGMDIDRIWEKAVKLGLVSASARESYSDREVVLLTCTPGFSTAETATNISGRGVGMDAVKGKIEYLGGSLSIASESGQGTEVSLSLPLTLAIVQALLIASGDAIYALGLSAVNEILGIEDVRVDTVDGAPVIIMRDSEVVPLHRLGALLGGEVDPCRPPMPGEHIIVVSVSGGLRALVVQSLVGRSEIVVKALSRLFKEVKGLGGATLLGDGRVALILDPRTLFPSREPR